MLFFAHTGFTLGLAELVSALCLGRVEAAQEAVQDEAEDPPGACAVGGLATIARPAALARPRARRLETIRRIDYRLVLVGFLLPDIIDKPLGAVFLADLFSNGRIVGHTLLFSLILGLAGIYWYRRHGQSALLVLSFGSLVHLALDQMWLETPTLLWPLYGWGFARTDISDWFPRMLQRLVSDPQAFIPEILGGLIIAQLAARLVLRDGVRAFVREGSLG